MTAQEAVSALRSVLDKKPGAVRREGQEVMAAAVAEAVGDKHHLLVEAGTGTGKSLAYLIAAVATGKTLVVATATKNLQNQLAERELPFLASAWREPLHWAVLKGRQSYVCMAKLVERFGAGLETELLFAPDDDAETLGEIRDWALSDPSGDRDDLPNAVSDDVWRSVSVSGMECPGKARCPQGDACFAEKAKDQASEAQVIVTNHHLYGLNLVSGGSIMPDHDVVVFDEAHRIETALSSAFGVDLGGGRLRSLANNAVRVVDSSLDSDDIIGALRDAADELDGVIRRLPGARLEPGDGDLGLTLRTVERLAALLVDRLVDTEETDPDFGRVVRAEQQAGHLRGDIALAFDLPENYVAWAEPDRGIVRVAPVEVAGPLAESLLVETPAVLTSATMTVAGSFASLARRLGFVDEQPNPDPAAEAVFDPIPRTYRSVAVEGSFDYHTQGLLYVSGKLPDPRSDEFADAAAAEMVDLVGASGGRALVLTTSHRMLRRFAFALEGERPYRVLVQGDLPKKRLIAEFQDDETSTLLATMGYWEGIDVLGRSLSLVVIDKIPFPRPDDPLMTARRQAVEARGGSGFGDVDLPHAAMLLAQGSGRLIRNETDHGVVAILDPRLMTKRYGARILHTLPRFRRTSDRRQAEAFLGSLG